MKFGKQIETAAFDLPENWRPHLIHYKTLKKSIRLVVDELESRGLSTEWLNTLDTDEAMRLDYVFDGNWSIWNSVMSYHWAIIGL